jgi:DNA-3-methyladenine glycosylase
MARLLRPDFFKASTTALAKKLLGKILCVRTKSGRILRGRIVETEAYIGVGDKACHAFGGRRTSRTESLYQKAGSSYVYLIYGMYYCFNVVARPANDPQAVLIRALAPVDEKSKTDLQAQGPGKLCRALRIDKTHDRKNLLDRRSGIWLEDDGYQVFNSEIDKGPRIGVDYAEEAAAWPLRFHIKGHPDVSKTRKQKPSSS